MKGVFISALVVCALAQVFRYGVHVPEGSASVNYLYSESGTWKKLDKIEYLWNYYNYTDNPKNHPYDIDRLIGNGQRYSAYSDGSHFTTCRDANKHLLLDYNHDGEIDVTEAAGWAFHQHNGRGVNDSKQGTPFSNFWFDDNGTFRNYADLAIVLSKAYGRKTPDGLSAYKDFTRWNIMSGNHTGWKPYENVEYLDLVALDGLYFIALKQKITAEDRFLTGLALAKASYNATSQRFDYFIQENYKLGLLAVFSSFLYEYTQTNTYLDHYVSLRSNLLTKLHRNPANLSQIYSWMVWNNSDAGNLFNTETMVLGSLGLSAGASLSFEAVRLNSDPAGLFIDNMESWVMNNAIQYRYGKVGTSKPGYMVTNVGYLPQAVNQNYTVEFILRAFNNTPSGIVARLELVELTGVSSNTRLIRQQDFQQGSWTLFRMDFLTTENKWDFNIFWTGVTDLQACLIRVKKPSTATLIQS